MLRRLACLLVLLTLSLAAPGIPAQAQEAATPDAGAAAAGDTQDATEADAPEGPQLDPALTAPGVDSDTLALLVMPLTVDELTALADAWLAEAKSRTEDVVDIRLGIRNAEEGSPEIDQLREALSDALASRNAAFENLGVATDSLALKGGDEATVATYRAYRSAILSTETQQTDWQTLLGLGLDWATDIDGGIALAIQVAIVIGSFLGLLIVARIVRGFARRNIKRVPNVSKLLVAFLSGIIYWLTLSIGLLVVLGALGVNITPLFALVGGATFILAFAMQETLSNLAAGVMIILNRPFDEGDYVTVAGTGGTVKAVSIVSTTVTTPDNQVIVIPNSRVWGDVITNVTASTTRRVDLVFGIGYDDSIEAAQRILEDVVAAHPAILSDPAPVVRVNALGASSVDFICRPWVRSEDYWTVLWDLTRQVKEAFDAAGITIPYPQQDMHLHVRDAGAAAPLGGPAHGVGRPEGAPDYRSGDDGAGETGGTGERTEA